MRKFLYVILGIVIICGLFGAGFYVGTLDNKETKSEMKITSQCAGSGMQKSFSAKYPIHKCSSSRSQACRSGPLSSDQWSRLCGLSRSCRLRSRWPPGSRRPPASLPALQHRCMSPRQILSSCLPRGLPRSASVVLFSYSKLL